MVLVVEKSHQENSIICSVYVFDGFMVFGH